MVVKGMKAWHIGGSDDRLIELITESLEDIGISVQEAPHHISGTQENNIVNMTKTQEECN